MRVLHLPSNVASQPNVTVRALREAGVEARGLVSGNLAGADASAMEVYWVPSLRRRPILGLLRAAVWLRRVRKAMRWADVIHWHSDWSAVPWDLELRYAAKLGKPRIVEFWGTDIRTPEIACAESPYMARVHAEHPRLFRTGRRSGPRTQARFARYGFACLIPTMDLRPYVRRDVFPSPYHTAQRLVLSDFEPRYPDPENPRPLLVHAPSSKLTKGTPAVLAAVERLRQTHALDFRLIYQMPHREAMALVRQCDVLLDQFVIGDFGVAALEAMALGKPVVCYVRPALAALYPPDFPLVNATQDNLVDVLKGLLGDGARRRSLGLQGRAYVEQHHDARKIALQLVAIYEELLANSHAEQRRAGP
jgi:hypothetical protein